MEPKFFDVMVDIETTGTDPAHAAMIQLAAVRFNLEEGTVDGGNMFDRCLMIPPGRYWDEDTRSWWGKNREVLNSIYSRMQSPEDVMHAFSKWAKPGNLEERPLRFWGKPITFDYMFVSSYCRQFGVLNPFHYRWATDLNSFIRGLAADSNVEQFKLPFEGDAHNALHDVLNQIKLIFKAKEHYRS